MLLLILAGCECLQSTCLVTSAHIFQKKVAGDVRKSDMGICDFLWQEKAVAGYSVLGIVIWFSEGALSAQPWERSEGNGDLVCL